jgi:hypothetical protein
MLQKTMKIVFKNIQLLGKCPCVATGNTILCKYKYFDDVIHLLEQSKMKWPNLRMSDNVTFTIIITWARPLMFFYLNQSICKSIMTWPVSKQYLTFTTTTNGVWMTWITTELTATCLISNHMNNICTPIQSDK